MFGSAKPPIKSRHGPETKVWERGGGKPADIGARNGAGTTDTFCINLWKHLRLEAGGEAVPCCAFEGGRITEGGVTLSVEDAPLGAIWNADMMRGLRRDMVEGRRIAGCRQCYADEDRGGLSMRQRDNASWEQGWLNEDRATVDDIAALAVADDFRLSSLPPSIEVEVGNLCNFKCRMCNGGASSLIAKDPIHQRWATDQFSSGYHDPSVETAPYLLRRPKSVARLSAELAGDGAGEIKRLYFIGGEPFLVREIRNLLEKLVASGHAPKIDLLFVTNGSVVPRWLSLAAEFHRVDLSVSVDGYGPHYDYIRFPGLWSELVGRLQRLRKIPNVHVLVTSTIQAYNALSITKLFRYLDSIDMGFAAYLLHWPRYLAVTTLPQSVRRIAAARLRDYGESDCRPRYRDLVLSLANQFDAAADAVDARLLNDFMLFTNDLDASRGQDIRQVDPELVGLLAEAGYPWPRQTVHAAAGP